jgi:hypothetical protein
MSFSPFSFNPESLGSAAAVVTDYTNSSASVAISQGQAVSVNSAGQLTPLDVSNQASWQAFVGYANLRIAPSSEGPVLANGRLKNVTTSYALGTALYIDTNGNPTNIIPSVGVNGFVSGDMVIFMGVVVPNEANPLTEMDFAIFTQLVGTL